MKQITLDDEIYTIRDKPYKVHQIRKKDNKMVYVYLAPNESPLFSLEFKEFSTQSVFVRELMSDKNQRIYFNTTYDGKVRAVRTTNIL